jgi:hypothetical protein
MVRNDFVKPLENVNVSRRAQSERGSARLRFLSGLDLPLHAIFGAGRRELKKKFENHV